MVGDGSFDEIIQKRIASETRRLKMSYVFASDIQLAVVWTLILQSESEGSALIFVQQNHSKVIRHFRISFSRRRGPRPQRIVVT
jgi:hypothetical protein